MNPLCACGCGLEVTHPRNKWVIGHMAKRKLTPEQVEEISGLLKAKVSQYAIAAKFGVSQALIAKFSWQDGYESRITHGPHSADFVRQEDLEMRKEKKQWQKGKRILKSIKRKLLEL